MLAHQALVTVTHDETGKSYGVFRTRAGGGREGENQLVRPGGMAKPKALPGTWAYGEVTCARLIEHTKDSGVVQEVDGLHGQRFTILEQPLDAKGAAGFHRPVAHSGLLNGSTPSDYDADGNDPSTLEMTFTVDEVG